MKKANAAQKFLAGLGLGTLSTASFAVVTVPAEVTTLFVDGAAMGVLVVTAGIVAYGTWRGGLTALGIAKRMLAKAGL